MIMIDDGGVLNNHLSDLTSYGGGRITVNSGGTLNADSQSEGVALDLQDSLLVNNGAVTGTTNVNYGATVTGSGSFGPINVNYGGMLAIASSASPLMPALTVSSGSITGSGAIGRARDAGRCHDHDTQPDRHVDAFRKSHRRRTAYQERVMGC